MSEPQIVTIAKMQTDIKYIKDAMESQSDKLDKFIEKCENKYATKEELTTMKNAYNWIVKSAFGFIWTATIALVTFILKKLWVI